ncbi:RNA polymerase subunit sigma-24 [bacterium SCGC AG-212-C10]|nr:RNA polymerase subunit sigma-24 [bacterium SCGC AG-212-C10]
MEEPMTHALATVADERVAEPDDFALVAAARNRPEAFGKLYERYLARMYRYLRTRTADAEEAADLTQAVFERAFHSLPGYQPRDTPFAAWLFRIARNAATDAHRRRRVTVSWDGLPEPLADIDPRVPEATLLRKEQLSELRARLASLDERKRELLALRFAAGLTSAEIAPLVGKSEAAVKKQLTRVIAQLKESYRDDK